MTPFGIASRTAWCFLPSCSSAASVLLAQLTAGQDVKIIKDLGLAASSAIGVLIAVFFGIGLVTKEVERRSIYSLLSKPVTRLQFVVGKYVGLVLTLLVNLAVMAAAFYAVLAYLDATTAAGVRASWEAPALDPLMLKAFALDWRRTDARHRNGALLLDVLESFSLRGAHLCRLLHRALRRRSEAARQRRRLSMCLPRPARGVYYVMPNLAALDVKSEVVHGRGRRHAADAARQRVERLVHRGLGRRGGDCVLAPGFEVEENGRCRESRVRRRSSGLCSSR